MPLLDFAALFFPGALARQRLFGAAAIARLQIEGVLLDILDDIFLLNLPFESPEREDFKSFRFGCRAARALAPFSSIS